MIQGLKIAWLQALFCGDGQKVGTIGSQCKCADLTAQAGFDELAGFDSRLGKSYTAAIFFSIVIYITPFMSRGGSELKGLEGLSDNVMHA